MNVIVKILFILSISNFIKTEEYETVSTNSGTVRGKILKTLFDSKLYYSFKGIPYAEPPINTLRYRDMLRFLNIDMPPRPVHPWLSTRDAFEFGNECHQPNFEKTAFIGDEDCLYLNIYTPDVKPESPLAVMFYIHGGAYFEGSGNDNFYGPDFLIEQNVILITINYRLGILGFLSFGTPEISGNQGLKDQLLALKWINENIENFGGDKNKITVFGQSAGGVSTHLHVLSKESGQYFKRAIIMSASIHNLWATSNFEEHLIHVFSLAKSLKRPASKYDDVVHFARSHNAKELIANSLKPPYIPGEISKEINILWSPIVEKKTNEDAFLTTKPESIYENESTQILTDVLWGFTNLESLFVAGAEINNPELLQPFNKHFEIPLPYKDSQLEPHVNDYKQISKEIRKFYFGAKQVDDNTLLEYTKLLSDAQFAYGIYTAVKRHVQISKGKTYFYRFSVDAGLNIYKQLFNATGLKGSSHADDICYLFRCGKFPHHYENLGAESIERNTIAYVTKLFTNFAKYGTPTEGIPNLDLEPVSNENLNYVDIRNDGLYTAINPNERSFKFWDELYIKHGSVIRGENYHDEL